MEFARGVCRPTAIAPKLNWKVLVYSIAMLLALAPQGHAVCSCDGKFDQFFTGGFGITSITLNAISPEPVLKSPDTGGPTTSGGSALSTPCLSKSGAYIPIGTSVPAGNANLSSYDIEIYLAPSAVQQDPISPECCVAYSEDAKFVSTTGGGTEGEATGPALIQGGKFYIADNKLKTLNNPDWNPLSLSCLKEGDFHLVPGCGSSSPSDLNYRNHPSC